MGCWCTERNGSEFLQPWVLTTFTNFCHGVRCCNLYTVVKTCLTKMDVIVLLAALFCFSLIVHHLLKNKRRLKTLLASDSLSRRVIFITAHPDDECMFFAPTILSFTSSGQNDVFLLCLSTGLLLPLSSFGFFCNGLFNVHLCCFRFRTHFASWFLAVKND